MSRIRTIGVGVDWVLLGSCIALVGFSLPSLWALGKNQAIPAALFWKQLFYGTAGIGIALLVSHFNVRIFQKHGNVALLGYALSLAALGGIFLFGETVHGTRAWYHIGLFRIAPVEFVKIALLILLAKFFSDRHRDLYTIRHIGISLLYTLLLVLLIVAQPDAGSALVVIGLWLGVVLFTGIRARWVAMLCLGAVLALGLLWAYGLKSYQRDRITAFLDSQREAQGSGYNVLQAKAAVGSGGFFGKSLGEGSQSARRFLPAAPTDFMFAAIAEEGGLVRVLALFMFFGLLWYRAISIGIRAGHNFGRIFAFGYAWLLAIHFFVNVGMNLGAFPVVGISLPFVSYGGSHMLATFLGLGILLGIGRETEKDRGIIIA
ncbi:MAG: FtsW/RodA/SpoVE family cell cycle protein [bacterium]|nr:FtsW/RodA/SpoVE family cell cycle protein [bacterium]